MTSPLQEKMLQELDEMAGEASYRIRGGFFELYAQAFSDAVDEWIENQPNLQRQTLARDLATKNSDYFPDRTGRWLYDAENNDIYYVETTPAKQGNNASIEKRLAEEVKTFPVYRSWEPENPPEYRAENLARDIDTWIDSQPDKQHRVIAQRLANNNPEYEGLWSYGAEGLRRNVERNLKESRTARLISRFHLQGSP